MEKKAFPIPSQVADDGTVKSILAVTGNCDLGNDVIERGAFTKTLQEQFPLGNIKVLWQHDANDPPIGTFTVLNEISLMDLPPELRARYPDATGALYSEWTPLPTPRAAEVVAGIKAGALTQNSIGFNTIKAAYTDMQGLALDPSIGMSNWYMGNAKRHIQEVQLFDGSPVNWGMNPATMNVKLAYVPQPYQQDPDETVQCQVCGRMNDTDAMYCDQCGAAIPGGPSTPYTVHMDESVQCPQCQRMNDVDARYCDQCDYKLAGSMDVTAKNLSGPDGVFTHIRTFADYFERNAAELKAGRVLSDANLQRLKTAHEHLTAVIATAEPSSSDSEKALTEARIARMLRDVELAELEISLIAD